MLAKEKLLKDRFNTSLSLSFLIIYKLSVNWYFLSGGKKKKIAHSNKCVLILNTFEWDDFCLDDEGGVGKLLSVDTVLGGEGHHAGLLLGHKHHELTVPTLLGRGGSRGRGGHVGASAGLCDREGVRGGRERGGDRSQALGSCPLVSKSSWTWKTDPNIFTTEGQSLIFKKLTTLSWKVCVQFFTVNLSPILLLIKQLRCSCILIQGAAEVGENLTPPN